MDRTFVRSGLALLVAILGVTACAPIVPATQSSAPEASATVVPVSASLTEPGESATPAITADIPVTGHLMNPGTPITGRPVTDVTSSGTSAPFGDSYKINRFERPFLKDMTYIADLDIASFNIGEDADWYYVSIELNGNDPNDSIGIDYGAEIDVNADGYGDYLIWAHPPYKTQWDTSTVQVFQDTNHDTAGLSSKQSDAVFDGNGYDRKVFDGSSNENPDPDLAWVRMQEGTHALVQFAFKKTWLGPAFMLGVVADAGPKNVAEFDYADHFKEAEAGSPTENSKYYPLGALFAVDNTCLEAYGPVKQTFEPKFCPIRAAPTATKKASLGKTPTLQSVPNEPPAEACQPTFDPADCGDLGYDPKICQCKAPTQEPAVTEPPATEPPQATNPPQVTEPPPPPPPPPTSPPEATQPPEATPPPAG